MLTVRGLAERSARFYGHHVRQDGETQTNPQKLLSSVSHIRITPFPGESLTAFMQQRLSLSYLQRRFLSILAVLFWRTAFYSAAGAVKYCPTSSWGRYWRTIFPPSTSPVRSQR